MSLETNFTVNYTAKTVTHSSGTEVFTVLAFFQWLAAKFAAEAQMDDDYAFVSDTPQVYRWVNTWNMGDETSYQFLKGGAITTSDYVVNVSGKVFSNLYSIGSQFRNSMIYIVQADAEVAPWWIPGNIDILIKTVNAGVLVDGGKVMVLSRDTDGLYDHNEADLSAGGRNPVGVNTFEDINYKTTGDIYLDVDTVANFDIGNFAYGVTSTASGRIQYVDTPNTRLYLCQVEGTFQTTENIVERATRTGANLDGTATNHATTAEFNVIKGYSDVKAVFVQRKFEGGTASGAFIVGEVVNQAVSAWAGRFVASVTKDTGLITINVVATAGTFTRTTGSYLTDGWIVGDKITTSGFTNAGNNTTKIIQTVTTTVITVTDTTGLVDESGNGDERVKDEKLYAENTSGTANGTNQLTGVTSGKTYTPTATSAATVANKNMNNGNGLQPYNSVVDCAGRAMLQTYQYLKYITAHNSASTINGDAGEEYRSAKETDGYTDLKQAPFGSFAGGTFFGARGVWVENYLLAAFSLTDADGDLQNPPNYQKVSVSHTLLSGCRVLIAERTGAAIIKNQYTIASTTTTTITVTTTINPNKCPQSGSLRVGDWRATYTGFSGAVFSGVSPDPTGKTGDLYVPQLDLLADATSEESANIILTGAFDVKTRVRKYGYKDYTMDTSFPTTGLAITPILATDPQAT